MNADVKFICAGGPEKNIQFKRVKKIHRTENESLYPTPYLFIF